MTFVRNDGQGTISTLRFNLDGEPVHVPVKSSRAVEESRGQKHEAGDALVKEPMYMGKNTGGN